MTCTGCQPMTGDEFAALRVRLCMCRFCAGAKADRCPRDGEAIGAKLVPVTYSCPRRRHPDADGIVRWLGVRWYGVPMPLRALAWLLHARGTRPLREYVRTYAGCGCVKVLRDFWDRIARG